MKIFKDLFSGDEMFSDTYRFKLIDGVMYEVYGKLITRKLGDVTLDGANPSAEEATEGTEEAVESGVDVVLNHRLMETYAFPDKKSFTLYLKEYMKRLVDRMNEDGSTEVELFKTNINKVSGCLLISSILAHSICLLSILILHSVVHFINDCYFFNPPIGHERFVDQI